ncbi:MAG: tetratricopeptide repeat protein [Sandaracinaceae bacterium]|nr:tetratricopeptide repeat protein [Sandaracinaceae bacterium]
MPRLTRHDGARWALPPVLALVVLWQVDPGRAVAQIADDDLAARRQARMERELILGNARIEAGQPSLAIAHFEDARRAQPSAPEPYAALGRTLLDLGRRADAIAALETGRIRSPDDEGLLLILSQALEANNQARQALALLRGAARRHPRRWATQARRADVAQAVGAFTEAVDAYAAVLDLASTGADVPHAERQRAEDTLAALSLLLDGAHPRTGHCAPSTSSASRGTDRWRLALAVCH